jgi:hypothetical protein
MGAYVKDKTARATTVAQLVRLLRIALIIAQPHKPEDDKISERLRTTEGDKFYVRN